MEQILRKVKLIFSNYWALVGVILYFALTGIYNEFGFGRDVIWNTYIKTVREGFLLFVIYATIKNLPNTLSILSFIGVAGYSLSLTVFRFYSAIKSWLVYDGLIEAKGRVVDVIEREGVVWYDVYYEMMKDIDTKHFFTIGIILILIIIHYLNKK